MNDKKENQEKNSEADETDYVQTMPVDLRRLRVVKITNTSGHTIITGTDAAEIKVRVQAHSGLTFSPAIEVKADGEIVEISSVLNNVIKLNLNETDATDPDLADEADFDFDPDSFDFGDPASHDREERYRFREEARRQREEARRYRQEAREEARRRREQGRRITREGGNIRVDLSFGSFEMPDVFKNVGKSLSQIFDSFGTIYIEVPRKAELDIKTVSGTLEIGQIDGFCRIKSTSGGTRLHQLNGGMQLKGMSGGVEGVALGGRVTIKTVSGKVTLAECRLTALDLSTTSGNLTVTTQLALPDEGDYRLNSTSGRIHLVLPDDQTSAFIECRTLSGRIVTPYQVRAADVKTRPGQSQAKIEINGGRRKVMLNTISGNIEVGLNGEESSSFVPFSTVPPAPPAPPPVPSVDWPTPPVAPGSPSGFGAVSSPPYPDALVTPPPAWPNYPPPTVRPLDVTPTPPNLSQRSASPTPPNGTAEAPTSPPPSPPAEDGDKRSRQLDILQAIERGELSVEEGMARLAELD